MEQPNKSSRSQPSTSRTDDESNGSAEDQSDCGSSSSVQWHKPAQLRNNPHLAHIHVLAGSDWSDELTQSQTGSIDCEVQVQVVVQPTEPVKSEAEQTAAPKRKRSGLRCCGITLLVLGLLATGVLVPIAVTVGFKQDIPPEYRVLQQPKPSHRLVFAFQSSALAAAARDVLPAHIASQVTSWNSLPSSGIHVAAFSEAQAMQQALAHLAAGSTSPSRSLLQGSNSSSSSSSWALKYAVSDFKLETDRQVQQVIDPMQLFDLAKQQTRALLQQQQQHGAPAREEEDEDNYLWRLEQLQNSWQQQRREQLKKAAAVLAASGFGEPETAAARDLSQQQDQQATRRHLAGHPAAELLPANLRTPTGATSAGESAEAVAAEAAARMLPGHPLFNAHPQPSSSSILGSIFRRRLLQAQPARTRPQLQLQQRQAQQQVQRGGTLVAWHLADAGLGVRDAWNVTSGLDRVVVAVLDSGVELASGAVGASLWSNAAEVAADGVDNDGNGYADDAMGWDFGGSCGDITCSFCAPGPDPTDTVGWGTHAAAAIAAQPEVASGTAGIAPGVRIMPLKVADCTHGTQMWDVATQQGDLVKSLDGSDADQLAQERLKQQMRKALGPTLLGSAAVQALDYAVINGAHIVLAGWSAGELVDSGSGSSEGQCFMGAAAAADQGMDSAAAEGGAGCVEAVQRTLFMDALKPLQEAGVLVVTMQDSASVEGATASASRAGAHLPCSLSCELDNVVCVSASTVVLPPNGTHAGLTDVLSAADFFAPLISQHSSSFFDLPGAEDEDGLRSDAGTSAGTGAGTAGKGAADATSVRLAALSCDTRGGKDAGTWARLRAPGSDILAGWAWGSHAAVSGSSAAASVTAGVAALAWSKLSQTLGADASPGAFEGLGQQVKQELLQGSSINVRSSGGSGSGSGGIAMPFSGDAAVTEKRSNIMGSGAGAEPNGADTTGTAAPAATLELDLFGTLQHSSKAPDVVSLQPAVLSAGVTSAAKSLRYSWHIQGEDTGPYDTNTMWYVGRKAIKPPAFPITRWEFYGSTSLVEAAGYLDVTKPGTYVIAASSEDRFVLWLQDWWLHMQEGDAAATAALGESFWTARVNFTAPGLYKLRLIIYAPTKPFNLQWKLPGSNSFSSITSFMSLGQKQPLPQQLLHSMLLPLATRADSSSERSSKVPPAAGNNKQPGTSTPSNNGKTYVASSSSSSSSEDSAPPGGPAPLPDTPGDSTAVSSGIAAGAPVADAPATLPGDGSVGAAPGADMEALSDMQSMTASMEPAEANPEGHEPMLAVDVTAEDAAANAANSAGAGTVPAYSQNSGYSLQPSYMPYAGAVDEMPNYGVSSGGGGYDFWSALRNAFGGSWFGRRRSLLSSHRRSLLAASIGSQDLPPAVVDVGAAGSRGLGMSSTSRSRQQQQGAKQVPHQQQQQRRHLAAVDATSSQRKEVAGRNSGSSSSSGGNSIWGRFSVGLTFAERTQYRTLLPDQTRMVFTHTGILPGPGLDLSGWLQLQETVLGYSDPNDNRGAYGMIQGWLDWHELNPTAAATIAAATGSAVGAARPASGTGGGAIATEGAGLGALIGGVAVAPAGVQFEVNCDSCSLQIDGMTVAGSLGGPEASSCVTPAAVTAAAARSSSSSGGSGRDESQLLHLSIVFTTNDVRKARFRVRTRPCSGINSQAGSGEWRALTAAGASSPPAFAVSSAAVIGQAGSPLVFTRGMLCAVKAHPPPAASAAAADGSSAAAVTSSGPLHRLVFLSAAKMQEAITIAVNATADSPIVSPVTAPVVDSANNSTAQKGNNSSSSRSSSYSLTVDAPQGTPEVGGDDDDSTGSSSSGNSTTSEEDAALAAAEAAAALAEQQRRAAQAAAAKAAALAEGISVADLVPDWVSSMPIDTQYSFSCGCYWNGSWEGNVSVSVSAAAAAGSNAGSSGSSGRAKVYLAGWPVAAKAGRLLGPSDLDVRGYSTLMQRQQLAAGSDSADPLVDAAHAWADGVFFDVSSSSSGDSMRGGNEAGASSGSGAKVLSAGAIRQRRHARTQQHAVSRASSSNGGGTGGGSSLLGLQPIGSLDGVGKRVIMPMAGHHQLLVLQAEGLSAADQVVVLAPGDTSSSIGSGSMLAAGSSSDSSNKASNGTIEVLSSWVPGPWDAWVPAG